MASTVASLQHEVSCQLVAFLQRLDTKLDNLTKHVLTIEVSVSRLEGCIGALETQSGQQAAEIVEIRADIVKMKKTANSVPASAPASVSSSLLPSLAGSYLSDPCEILLTGLPADANLTDREALDRVFTTIGLKDYSKF
ncbi:hypothetical protein TKK_0010236 [Trichogramma kaykai]